MKAQSGWSTPRPGRFTPGNYTGPTVQEAGWAAGPVWMGVDDLASPGFEPLTVQPVASRCADCAIPINRYSAL